MMQAWQLPQIAANYQIKETIFAANALVQQCLTANPNRVALYFSDQLGNINFATQSGNVSGTKGLFCLPSAQITLIAMTFWTHGPLVQSPWFCCRVSGTSNLGIAEIIYVPTG